MLVYNTKIENLRGMRIALDATCWLRSIQMLKDPYADALGGCSPGLFGIISKELESFSKLNITPIFVFDGIVPPLQHQMFQQSPGQLHLENAWTQLANNKDADAQKSFAVATSRINSDICHFVFHFLRSKGHECIRAPYVAGPQLANLASSNMVQAVLGQPGLLLYGIKKVLLGLDFSKGLVEWIELDSILHQWGVNKAQFAEICLLAGTEYCLTYPYLNLDYFQPGTSSFSFQSAVDFIRQMPLANWMNTFPTEEMKNDHVNGYCVSKTLLSHCPIVNLSDLKVEPFTSTSNAPSDLSALIGERLPQSVYALLVQGHLSYRLPSVLATGEWNDRQPPLIDTLEYRALVVELEEYRSKTLGLLVGPLPQHFKIKEIECKSYFDPVVRKTNPLSKSWLKWRFTREELNQELKRQNVKAVDLRFCLRWHANEFEKDGPLIRNLATATPIDKCPDSECFTASTLFMVLETLDYISEEGGMTVLGDVMKDAPSGFEESVLLALEMMKFGVLTGEPLEAPEGKPFPQAVKYPAASRPALLLSRVLSLVPMNLRNDLWSAKVDFDLAAFHCLVRSLNRSLRLVLEGCVANQVLRDASKAKLIPAQTFNTNVVASNCRESSSSLPAMMLPRACLGIVTKFMLDYTGGASSFEADVKKKFPCAADPVGDLKSGFAFWAELLRIVTAIADPLGTTEMLEEMKTAGKLLEEKRRLLAL